jgi:septal ring factor EnvC (AmiA/AmiB activator)
MRRVVAGFALSLSCVGFALAAEPASSLASRKADATRQQKELRERIHAIQKDIDRRESAQRDAADQLRASESAISDINRRLVELADEARVIEQTQHTLDGKMATQRTLLAKRRAELADQLRAQYADGLSPWTALLSGNDPQAIGRDLSYLGYISRARAETVRGIQRALANLADLRSQSEEQGRKLADVRKSTAEQKTGLQNQEEARQQVLSRIEAQLKAQRAQASHMARDEQHLGQLIGNLDKAIAEAAEAARRAEAARKAEEARKAAEAARKARAAQLAREQAARKQAEAALAEKARRQAEAAQAEQARQQVEAAAQAEKARQQAQEEQARRPAQAAQEAPQRQQAPVEQARRPAETEPAGGAPTRPPEGVAPRGGFHGLEKGLPYPVRGGEVQGRFGTSRPDGGVWRGIVLRAPAGTPVHVIAAGRVVYANWLSGFGNIMIVDHGDGYMSIYAYNQSLLKRVGDIVRAGDTIASVGATGGQVESGLYFEIRHRGAPVNPLLWLRH